MKLMNGRARGKRRQSNTSADRHSAPMRLPGSPVTSPWSPARDTRVRSVGGGASSAGALTPWAVGEWHHHQLDDTSNGRLGVTAGIRATRRCPSSVRRACWPPVRLFCQIGEACRMRTSPRRRARAARSDSGSPASADGCAQWQRSALWRARASATQAPTRRNVDCGSGLRAQRCRFSAS